LQKIRQLKDGRLPHRVVWDRGYYKRTDVAERAGPAVLAVAVEGVDAGSVNTSGQWKTFIAICTLPVTKTETSFFRNSFEKRIFQISVSQPMGRKRFEIFQKI